MIFLLLKTTRKKIPLFKAQDLLADLSLSPLKWKNELFPQSCPGINLWSPLGALPSSFQRESLFPPHCSSHGKWEFPFWEWDAPSHELFKTFHWEPEVERIPLESAEGSAEGTLHSRGKRENAESAPSFLQKQGNPGIGFAAAKGICPLVILGIF